MPVDDANLDYHLLEEFELADEDGDTRRIARILLVAAAREVVDAFVEAARRRRPAHRPASTCCRSPWCGPARPVASVRTAAETEAIVDIGADVVSVVVHTGGVPRYVRIDPGPRRRLDHPGRPGALRLDLGRRRAHQGVRRPARPRHASTSPSAEATTGPPTASTTRPSRSSPARPPPGRRDRHHARLLPRLRDRGATRGAAPSSTTSPGSCWPAPAPGSAGSATSSSTGSARRSSHLDVDRVRQGSRRSRLDPRGRGGPDGRRRAVRGSGPMSAPRRQPPAPGAADRQPALAVRVRPDGRAPPAAALPRRRGRAWSLLVGAAWFVQHMRVNDAEKLVAVEQAETARLSDETQSSTADQGLRRRRGRPGADRRHHDGARDLLLRGARRHPRREPVRHRRSQTISVTLAPRRPPRPPDRASGAACRRSARAPTRSRPRPWSAA